MKSLPFLMSWFMLLMPVIQQRCCSGTCGETDSDSDGYPATSETGDYDCVDTDASIHPGADELEDGKDNDCNNRIDDGTAVFDDDGDCVCEATDKACTGSISTECTQLSQGDCDDADADVQPGATEICDSRDDDCNGLVDDLPSDDPPCAYSPAACDPDSDAGCTASDECVREPTTTTCTYDVADGACDVWTTSTSTGVCTKAIDSDQAYCERVICPVAGSTTEGGQDSLTEDGTQCSIDGDCPAGSTCVDGACASSCDGPEDCSSGKICTSRGFCGYCSADYDCADGAHCSSDGLCVAAIDQCQSVADCGANQQCTWDGLCETLDNSKPGWTVEFRDCDDDVGLALSDIVIDPAVGSATICVVRVVPEGGSTSGTSSSETVALRTVSADAGYDAVNQQPIPPLASTSDGTSSLLSLDLSGFSGAKGPDSADAWTAPLELNVLHPLTVSLRGGVSLDWRGASPVVQVSGAFGVSSLVVRLPGGSEGGYLGKLAYDSASRPDLPLSLVVATAASSSAGAHDVAVLADGSALLQQSVRGTWTDGDGGAMSLVWYETLDASAYDLESSALYADPWLGRRIYRKLELTGTEEMGDTVTGTFKETLRGLGTRDLVSTGTFSLMKSNRVSIAYEAAIDDLSDSLWSGTPSQKSAFDGGQLPPVYEFNAWCDGYYTTSSGLSQPSGLPLARCLWNGEDCAYTGAAYGLGSYLETVESSYASTDTAYGAARYTSQGVCDVELDLYFGLGAYDGGSTAQCTPYTTELGQGACQAVGEPGWSGCYAYQLGDPAFQPCCADPNRLHCSAENYAVTAALDATNGTTAAGELWNPLRGMVGAHIYDAQQLRWNATANLNDYDFTLEQWIAQQEAPIVRFAPAMGLILSPVMMTGIDAVPKEVYTGCAVTVDGCPYTRFMEGLIAASREQMVALEELGEVWQRAEGDALTARMKWLTLSAFVNTAAVDYLVTLDQATGAATSDGSFATSYAGPLGGLGSDAQTVVERTTLGLSDRNTWGYPKNYVPNPTSQDGDFQSRLEAARAEVRAAAQVEADSLEIYDSGIQSQSQVEEHLEALKALAEAKLETICGTDPDTGEALDAERCGLGSNGTYWDGLEELEHGFGVLDAAELALNNHIEKLQLRQAEADNVIASLYELQQQYDDNYQNLQTAIDGIQLDYTEGWEQEFADFQEQNDELYADLQALYVGSPPYCTGGPEEGCTPGLYQQTTDYIEDTLNQNIYDLQTNCSNMMTTAQTRFDDYSAMQADRCNKVVKALQDAQKRAQKRKKKRGLLRKIVSTVKTLVSGGVCLVTGGDHGCGSAALSLASLLSPKSLKSGECGAACLEAFHCDQLQNVASTVFDTQMDTMQLACSNAEQQMSHEALLHMRDLWWNTESETLELYKDRAQQRIETWYEYRIRRMENWMNQQTLAEVLAANHANRQATVTQQLIDRTAYYSTAMQMAIADLTGFEAAVEQAEAEVDNATSHLHDLHEQAEQAGRRIDELEQLIAQSERPDPSFQLVTNEVTEDIDESFDTARRYAWLALRSYEYETSADYLQSSVFKQALSANQLCAFLDCLAQAWDHYMDAFSDWSDTTDQQLSVRHLLGLDLPVVDHVTGRPLEPGQRFGAYLDSPARLVWDPNNAVFHAQTTIQTQFVDRTSLWDDRFCNEKLESIQVVILCKDCMAKKTSTSSPATRAWLYLTARGGMERHSCMESDTDAQARYRDEPADGVRDDYPDQEFNVSKETLIEAAISSPDVEIDWSKVKANTSLNGLNPIFETLDLTIVNPEIPHGNGENTYLIVPRMEDILVRLNYVYQSKTSWDAGEEPDCQLPTAQYGSELGLSCGL